MSSIKWVAIGWITAGVLVLVMWFTPLGAPATPQEQQPRAHTSQLARGVAGEAPRASDPASHYIAASSVERPPVVRRPPPRVIEPADPARVRPAMHSVNGVDGD